MPYEENEGVIEISQTTYQVTLSMNGNHTVTVTTDNQAETQLAIAWARATFDRLLGAYGNSVEQARNEEKSKEGSPICAVHQVPMVRVKGRRGGFWSCHQKNADGSWCTYKPMSE